MNTKVGQLYFFYVLPSSFLKQIQEEISHLIQELSKLHSEITNLKNQIVSRSKEISSSRGIYMNMYVNSIYITKAYNECNIMSDFWRGLLVLSFKKVSDRPTSGFCRFQVILRWYWRKHFNTAKIHILKNVISNLGTLLRYAHAQHT